MQPLFIINENSRAANYGIGTYLSQLLSAVKDLPYDVHVINLRHTDKKYPTVEEKNGVKYINIPPASFYADGKKEYERYCRNAFYLLRPYFEPYAEVEILFHFNFFNAKHLAILLKEHCRCRILLTVHYMSWSFELLGDVAKLKTILDNPQNKGDEAIKESFESEKRFIDECCDKVIAIAQHSYYTLRDIYQIPESKMTIIGNGLEDVYSQLSEEERCELRKKYHIAECEKVVIFAGRLDPVKGLSLLISAFSEIMTADSSVRLIVAGDGNLQQYFNESTPFWSRVTFTGFVDKEHLYNLYRISDIGVLPSLHEEFGYVALEMMMMGLPLVVSRSTGLSELVVDGQTGVTVPLICEDSEKSKTVAQLREAITDLLNDSALRETYRLNTRVRFLENYQKSIFHQKLADFYCKF